DTPQLPPRHHGRCGCPRRYCGAVAASNRRPRASRILRSGPQRGRMAYPPARGPLSRAAPGGYRAALQLTAAEGTSRRHLPLRGLRPAALLVGNEVRFRDRLAELLCGVAWGGRHQAGQVAVHGADLSPLPPLRRTPRPYLRRRPAADRLSPLPYRAGFALPAQYRIGADRPQTRATM